MLNAESLQRRIWLIADTHWNHKRLIQLSGRPDNFEALIGYNLHEIKARDILIHLGDICIGKDKEVHTEFIMSLFCKKWLVRGNHDNKSNSWYIRHGWDFVCDSFSDVYFGTRITFSHKPVEWTGQYDLNIHGHFHNTDHRSHEPELRAIQNERQRLLAIEYTEYKPVLLETFINHYGRFCSVLNQKNS